jgi:hypothetical protein
VVRADLAALPLVSMFFGVGTGWLRPCQVEDCRRLFTPDRQVRFQQRVCDRHRRPSSKGARTAGLPSWAQEQWGRLRHRVHMRYARKQTVVGYQTYEAWIRAALPDFNTVVENLMGGVRREREIALARWEQRWVQDVPRGRPRRLPDAAG